jgi:hypothetical protein
LLDQTDLLRPWTEFVNFALFNIADDVLSRRLLLLLVFID